MKIGLDFDGVFCNVEKLFAQGKQKFFNGRDRLTRKETDLLKDLIFEEDNFELEMIPGAKTACRRLTSMGHELKILTKRDGGAEIAHRFCKEIGLDVPVIGTPKGKKKSFVSRDFDIFLDDSVSNLEDLDPFVSKVFLFSPNRTLSDFEVVASWDEFSRKIA